MRIMTLLFLLVSATSVHAEVYKCYTPSKKVSYQPAPCSADSGQQNIIEIQKQSPQQIEEAQRQLDAMRAERMQRDQELQSQREKAAEQQKLDAAQREAAAARQDAGIARREAQAAKQAAEEARQAAQTPVIMTYPRYNNYGDHHKYDYRNNQRPVVSPPKASPFPVPKPMSPYQNSK